MRNAWAFLLVAGLAINAAAQGTFLPATYASDPNFDHSGGTVYETAGVMVYGSGFQGQYYIGPANATDASTLVAVGPQAGFLGNSPTDPNGAGYFEGNNNGVITTTFAGGSTVTLQLRAWKGTSTSTYAGASEKAGSILMQIVLGNPNGSPPTAPASITSMPNFSIASPEPATIFLALIGAGALFIRRRKI